MQVFLPKFKLDARYDKMPDQLKQLGMVNAFISPGAPGGADFSGMNGAPGLYYLQGHPSDVCVGG